MTAKELRKKYLDFFIKKGHKLLPNVPLIPENDPTALFVSAGMHPLVPYLLGEPHPLGKKLVSNQRCLRTVDIEKVGNTTHHTFFEMLGNWSLGDPASPDGIGQGGYWKKEAIEWSWEFLTKKLNLDPKRISVSVFAGDKDSPRDEESAKIWRSLGIFSERIYFFPKENNWWGPVGETGPCGPDTEMFYDVTGKPHGPGCRPEDGCGRFFEIWNDVFMEYNKTADGKYEPLKQKNVDTGMGVERTVAVLNGLDDNYQTELFSQIIRIIEGTSGKKYEGENRKPMRIMADHTKAAAFIIADGVLPGKVEQGYVLRRLIRRAIDQAKIIGYTNFFRPLLSQTIKIYEDTYPEIAQKEKIIYEVFEKEESSYSQAIKRARKILLKLEDTIKVEDYAKAQIVKKISGEEAFKLYSTHGLSPQQLRNQGYEFDQAEFDKAFKKHQEISRKGAEKKFAGGLANHSKEVTQLHTATHLLHQALRDVLGKHIRQVGSNITPERLRFDFTHPNKLSELEIKRIERLVNEKIKADLPVKMEIMPLAEAKKRGALAFFGERYQDKVKVYSIGNYSKEVCGGPHVSSTGGIGSVKIIKEQTVSAGRRRIYAQLR
jgi:alanyl-tRNA synthetase